MVVDNDTEMRNLSVKNKEIKLLPLDDLLLDNINPRFANYDSVSDIQRDILNFIVKQFGIDDVLSSISSSGYFSAEPLVCRQNDDGKYTVIEGNRRLAACLILSGDDRARDQINKCQKYQKMHLEHGSPAFSPVPSIVFYRSDSQKQLLSYLGVRHIVSTKEWDSFAKAAWVSHALEVSDLKLDDIAGMIGDTNGAIKNLLRGYHFIRQLEKNGKFNPENTMKKGRGSNSYYPFSWIYTVLSFKSVQEFTKLENDPESIAPIPKEKLDDAALIVRAMFGDRSNSKPPAINDSRQITKLASAVADPEKVVYLREGKDIDEIERLTQPLVDLLGVAMVEIKTKLSEVNARLDGESDDLSAEDAQKMLKLSSSISKLASSLNQKIKTLSSCDE